MTQLNLPLRVVPVPDTNLVEIKDSVGEQLVKVEADDIFEVFVEAVNRSAAAAAVPQGDWYVDEYQPGRWWIRRDAEDGSIETIAQDVSTREQANLIVTACNRSAAAEKLAEAIEQYLDHATDSEKNLDAALAAYRKDLSDGP